jgi:hypothetical protein
MRLFLWLIWAFIWCANLGWANSDLANDKIWDFSSNNLQGWAKTQGLSAAAENGALVLKVLQPDSHIANEEVAVTPSNEQEIVIKYRATGLPTETTGQIFYGNATHGYDDAFHWTIPSLISDGSWHEIVLRGQADFSGDFKDWCSSRITSLRLDMVDQCPGQVEISYFQIVSNDTRWKIKSLSEIETSSPRKYLIEPDSFTLQDAHHTGTITLPQGRFSIWARAMDNPSGKMAVESISFDGADKLNPSFSGSNRFGWFLAGRSLGGTITISTARTPTNSLDCLLVAEGEAVPSDKAIAPIPKVKSEVSPTPIVSQAESHSTAAPYWSGYMLTHPDSDDTRPVNSGNVSMYFRRPFIIPTDMESAWCQITADDFFKLYLNGEKIAENLNSESWRKPTVVDVTSRLKPGKNVLAVESINAGGAGGMLFDLTLTKTNGDFEKLVSDERFVCHNKLVPGWTALSFDDHLWTAPRKLAPPPAAPWLAILPYIDKTPQISTECVTCDYLKEVKAGEMQKLTIQLKSKLPFKTNEVLYLRLENQGEVLSSVEVPLSGDRVSILTDGSARISVASEKIPKYYSSCALEVKFGIYGRNLIMPSGFKKITFSVKALESTGKLESKVVKINGSPQLFVNGKALYPVIGAGWTLDSGYDRAKANIRAFRTGLAEAPEWWLGPNHFDFSCVDKTASDLLEQDPSALIMPIFWVNPPSWWNKDHPDDISKFSDGTVWPYYRSTCSFSSEAWRVDASNAIREFVKHMESSPYGDRVVGYWPVAGVSLEWQGWGSHTSHQGNHLMDYSAITKKAFRDYMKLKHPGLSPEIPDLQERLKGDLGNFRDPKASAVAIAYDQYYSESIADAIIYFGSLIKSLVHEKKIVGVYFGYSLEYGNMSWMYQISGHNAVRKVLDSPVIDFIAAPPSYGVRGIGDCGEEMHAFASIHEAGKMDIVDDDTRTHICEPTDYYQTINSTETEAVLRRNFGRQLCRLNPLCLLAINSGRNFRSPEIERDIRITGRAGQYLFDHKISRKAEIAVVVDEDSAKYVTYDKSLRPSGEITSYTAWNGDVTQFPRKVNTLTGDLIYYQRTRLDQMGAPIDYLLMSDLQKDPPPYKLWIFLSCFQYDEATCKAVEALKAKGATVLWMYAPGFITNGTANVRNMEKLTGIRFGMLTGIESPQTRITDFTGEFTSGSLEQSVFGVTYPMSPLFFVNDPEAKTLGVYCESGKPSLAVKNVGKSRFLFCGSNKIPADLLRNIARSAGVHLYSESLDFVDANDRLLMLHAQNGGEKTLKLKNPCDIVDLYTGEVVQLNRDTFSFNLPKDKTRVFFLGDSKEFINYMNYPKLYESPMLP